MTKDEAIQWVQDRDDYSMVTDEELAAAFAALYGREPDTQDIEEGMWSHCCAAVD